VNGGHCRGLDNIDRQDEISVVKQVSNLFSTNLFKIQALLIPMWCLMALCLFGQSFLLPVLLEDDFLSLSYKDECWLLLLHQACEIPGLIVLSLTIDRMDVGRKRSIAISSALCAASSILLVLFWQQGFRCILVLTLVMKVFAVMPFQGEREREREREKERKRERERARESPADA